MKSWPTYHLNIKCFSPEYIHLRNLWNWYWYLKMQVKQEVLHWNLISIATYEDIVAAKISLSRPTLHTLYTNSRLFSFEPPRLRNHLLSKNLEMFEAESVWEKSHQSVFPFILWSPPSTTTCLTKSFGKNENLSVILKMSWFILYEWKFAISSYFSRSQRSGLKAPLWVTVFSTMKILTTRSDTSLNITSRVSTWKQRNRKVWISTTSKEKRSIKAIFLGFGRTVPEKAGSLQLGTEGRGGREQLLEGATSQTSYLSFF